MQKVKKETIVIEFFSFITQKMIDKNIVDPAHVKVSLNNFKQYINNKLGVELHSRQHIYQQLQAYAREYRIRLFQKENTADDFVLSLLPIESYREKIFLHIGLKIAIAHGIYDLISHLYKVELSRRPLNIYMSAGTETPYFAKLLFEKYKNELNIYTHNLGIIEYYLQQYQKLEHIHLHTRFSKFHAESFTLLEQNIDQYAQTSFDAIVGTTGYLDESGLYISSEEENNYKKNVFSVIQGIKVLALTSFELRSSTMKDKYKFSQLKDYDYLIVPSVVYDEKLEKKIKKMPFSECIISYYTYKVFKNLHKNNSLPY